MDTTGLRNELKNKERKVSDLVRFIETRTDNNPNYSLLLGAGCSVTSNIRSAFELIQEWKKELYTSLVPDDVIYNELKATDYFLKEHASWYNRNNEYSSLFEKRYDLPRQRRMFVEREVACKTPSLGYAYLTKLVKETYFNTIFTTNFDDLINEAFYQFSDERPIVCAHDSAISSITITSKRPKIIKLHGDYLFDDIKSTLRETESLEENIKSKFVEFAKDYGLIVIGYGGNDRSIMDVITYLLKHEDYYKNGIYWCLRPGSYVSEELRKLLWRDRAYYIVSDGFDEFFAEVSHYIFGDKPPIENSVISNKSNEIISNFINNQFLNNSKSNYIKSDLEKLRNDLERNNLIDLLNNIKGESKEKQFHEVYSDKELLCLITLSELDNNESYAELIKKGRASLSEDIGKDAKIKILQFIVNAHKALGELEKAIYVCDELLKIDNNDAKHYIAKSRIIEDFQNKIQVLDDGIKLNEFSSSLLYEKARNYSKYVMSIYGPERKENYGKILEIIDLGITRNPSIYNLCWNLKFEVIQNFEEDKIKRDKFLREIISTLSEQDKYDDSIFEFRLKILDSGTSDQNIEGLLSELDEIAGKVNEKRATIYHILYLKTLSKFNRLLAIDEYMAKVETSIIIADSREYLIEKSNIYTRKFDRLHDSIDILKRLLNESKTEYVIRNLAYCYFYTKKYDEFEKLLEKEKYFISKVERLKLRLKMYEDKHDFDNAYEIIEELKKIKHRKYQNVVDEVFLKLLDKKYKDAQEIAKRYLDGINFDLNAEALIVNYELAGYKIHNKLSHKDRLYSLIKHSNSDLTKAAIYALLDDTTNCIEYLGKAIQDDKTSKYDINNWPVFDAIRKEKRFRTILNDGIEEVIHPVTNVVALSTSTETEPQ